jgi:hypothetical protein
MNSTRAFNHSPLNSLPKSMVISENFQFQPRNQNKWQNHHPAEKRYPEWPFVGHEYMPPIK